MSKNGATQQTVVTGCAAQRDLLTGQHYKRGGTGVAERLYTYNALGIPTTRRTARQGTVRHDAFGYNERSELTSAALGSAPYAYAYDNIDNRKTAQEDAEAVTYAANELNQYTDITTGEENFIPEYDRNGKSPDGCKGDWTNREARLPRRGEPPMGRRRINQTRIRTSTGIWTASYNAQNRPTRFTRENADGTRTVITAAYDYLGRRAWKKVETIAPDPETGEETAMVTLHQRYIYRGYLQVAACDLTRGGHPCLWLITWDPTQPIATRPLGIQKDGTWYCYGWDLTKNICEVFGQAGYIRTTYSYTPYGSVTEEGDVTQPLQWSSEYADLELGLVYYNYRSYNPTDGRWIRRDIDVSTNLYEYVANSPYFSDFLGLLIILKLINPKDVKAVAKSMIKDPDFETSWEWGLDKFEQWFFQSLPESSTYVAPQDREAVYMQNSPAGMELESFFEKKNAGKPCCQWSDVKNYAFKMLSWESFSSIDTFWKHLTRTLKSTRNGVEFFSGSVDGEVRVENHGVQEQNVSTIRAQFIVTNATNFNSFALHIPEKLGRYGKPFDNLIKEWRQTFIWYKDYSC